MEDKKILVTGGTGFMGSWICKSLIKKGYNEIYCIDDLSGGNIDNIRECIENIDFTFINQDLSNTKKTKEIIEDIEPEIIYHLAANAREGGSFFQPLEIVRRNYYAYMNMLEPAIKTGKLDKVILFSSMAVYGNQITPFDENMERQPVDIYGINKAAMEQTTELLSDVHSFRYTILRPHNVFGEFQSLRDKYRNVIGIMMNKIMCNEPIYVYGDGNQQRAFSYIADSLSCYINAMDDKCDSEIINIGGKTNITINRLTELIGKYMGVDIGIPRTGAPLIPVEHLPDRYSEVKMAYSTWKKSTELLGYKEDIGYEEGIKRMAKWARDMGPQKWTTEKLSLFNDKCPKWWN